MTHGQHALRAAGKNSEARLDRPTAAVRDSYLSGMRAICAEDRTSPVWLDKASEDFARFAARSRTRPGAACAGKWLAEWFAEAAFRRNGLCVAMRPAILI
jgi:hypothetical protein